MNLVTIIENIEIERANNKGLGEAVEARLLTLAQSNGNLLSQAQVFVAQLEEHRLQIDKALAATKQEIAERDAALAALIGGE